MVFISLTIDAFGLVAKAGTDAIDISYTFDDTFQSSFFTSISANQVQFRDTEEILSVLYKQNDFQNLRAFGQKVNIIREQ